MKHKTNRRYDEREKQIIYDSIERYPANLGIAFEQAAAQMPHRTPAAVSAFYYSTIKKGNVPTFAIATRQGAMINTKSVRRPAKGRTKLSAFEVALMATEEMTQDEMKALILHMIKRNA